MLPSSASLLLNIIAQYINKLLYKENKTIKASAEEREERLSSLFYTSDI
jgi:hypothetical protein